MEHDLSIGALAKSSGVNVETIRYYQRRGLLREPAKPLYGYRRYSKDDIRRVRFIKRAQTLGFTLDEIVELLSLEEVKSCQQTRSAAASKIAVIETKIADLTRMRKALSRLVRACDAATYDEPCPIIHLLSKD